MTEQLENRLKNGKAPFDFTAAVAENEPNIAIVRDMLTLCADFLEPMYGEINLYHDWHKHDGFPGYSASYSWKKLRTMLDSTQSLYDGRVGEDSVSLAIHPNNYDWLLRFNIDDEDASDHLTAWCDLDFCATPDSKAFQLIEELVKHWPLEMKEVSSKEYFDNSYAG